VTDEQKEAYSKQYLEWCEEDQPTPPITATIVTTAGDSLGWVNRYFDDKFPKIWEEEYYWAADEAVEACRTLGLHVTYKQVSSCGGVFVFGPPG
jgi:hypothetical protein